jgi:hypothetical protein
MHRSRIGGALRAVEEVWLIMRLRVGGALRAPRRQSLRAAHALLPAATPRMKGPSADHAVCQARTRSGGSIVVAR